MLNMIKMEVYRMFHTKSAYIIMLVMVFCVLFTNYMSFDEYNAETEAMKTAPVNAEVSYTDSQGGENETPNLGLTVTLPTTPGERVTVYDLFFANVQGKFIALFIAIFTVIFSNADLNSGFVKNTAGQVRNRFGLVAAKTVAVVLYTILTLVIFTILEVISARVLFGYLEWGNVGEFLSYFGIQAVLHCAFMIVLTAVSVILRSNVLSMLLGVCLCMNFTMMLYGMVNLLIQKLGFESFDFMTHTVTGKISMIPMEMSGADIRSALMIAAAFIAGALALAGTVFQKRDV